MSLIDTYFNANYQDFADYYGERKDADYKYVLFRPDPINGVMHFDGIDDRVRFNEPLIVEGRTIKFNAYFLAGVKFTEYRIGICALGWGNENIEVYLSESSNFGEYDIVVKKSHDSGANLFTYTLHTVDEAITIEFDVSNTEITEFRAGGVVIESKPVTTSPPSSVNANYIGYGGGAYAFGYFIYGVDTELHYYDGYPGGSTAAGWKDEYNGIDGVVEGNPDESQIVGVDQVVDLLKVNPDGWSEVGLSFQRNLLTHGINRFYSFPLQFPAYQGIGGYETLLKAYTDKAIEATMQLQVWKLNRQTSDYDLQFTGNVDFSVGSYKDTIDYIECKIIDSDVSRKAKEREELNINLRSNRSVENENMFSVLTDSIAFPPIAIRLEVIETGNFNDSVTISPTDTFEDYPIYFYASNVEFNGIGNRLDTTNGSEDPATRTAKIYTNNLDKDVGIYITDTGFVSQNSQITFFDESGPAAPSAQLNIVARLQVIREDETIRTSVLIQQTTYNVDDAFFGGSPIKSLPFTWDLTDAQGYYLVLQNERIELVTEVSPTISGWGGVRAIYEGDITTNLNFYEQSGSVGTTNADSFYIHEAFYRVIQAITDNKSITNVFRSNLLGKLDTQHGDYNAVGKWANLILTNGFSLRDFPSRAINASLKDLFKSMDAIEPIGLGFDWNTGEHFIEERGYFYDTSYLMFDLGEINELEITPDKDRYFNEIISGYDGDYKYEDFQGANEFNSKTEHALSVPYKKKLNARSKYRADSVGVELTRRKQYSLSAVEDTQFDDSNFMLWTNNGSVIQGGSAGGFIGIEDYYNQNITPRENLVRHSAVINGAMWKKQSYVRFLKSEKKTDITYTTEGGKNVSEFDDITAEELSVANYYNPEIYKFQSYLTAEMINIMLTNPHGFITFAYRDKNYQGFIDSIESEESGKATFTLIGREALKYDNRIWEEGDNKIWESGDNAITEFR